MKNGKWLMAAIVLAIVLAILGTTPPRPAPVSAPPAEF